MYFEVFIWKEWNVGGNAWQSWTVRNANLGISQRYGKGETGQLLGQSKWHGSNFWLDCSTDGMNEKIGCQSVVILDRYPVQIMEQKPELLDNFATGKAAVSKALSVVSGYK